MRIYARNSQSNDPITSPKVNGTISLVRADGSLLPIPVNSSGYPWIEWRDGTPVPPGFDYMIQLNNKAYIDLEPVPRNGIYQVTFWRDSYQNKTQNLTIEAVMVGERVDKYVIMSPELTPGQTRIIYTWQEVDPMDMDMYITAIKKEDDSICKISFANKNCAGVTQDRCIK